MATQMTEALTALRKIVGNEPREQVRQAEKKQEKKRAPEGIPHMASHTLGVPCAGFNVAA